MSRNLPSAVATAIAGTVVRLAFFAEFQFASGTLRMWSGNGDKNWNSQTWTGGGDHVGISPIDESTDGASGMAFSLSGVPNTLRALALADNYRGRFCKAWLAILDASDNVVDAYQFYAGRMDVMTIEAASATTSRITLQSENRLIDLFRARTSRYTNAEQERLSPGDTSLSRVAKIAERPLPWGVPAASTASAGSSSGFLKPSYPGLV